MTPAEAFHAKGATEVSAAGVDPADADGKKSGATAEVVPFPQVMTPPQPGPLPAVDGARPHDLSRPEYYLNRELTWLNFNFRVLHEAEDERNPLLERLRFVAIVGSNIDEFFMKRIGGLKQQVEAGVLDRTVDGRTPEEQIAESYELVRKLEQQQRGALQQILEALPAHGVVLTTYSELDPEDQNDLREYYFQNVFPLVTPQATDPAHPFPFVSNLSLNLLVTLRYPGETTGSLARVKVPVGAGTRRFLRVGETNSFVPLESVMAHNLDLLFPGMDVESCERFRVTRNAKPELDEEEADDLLALIETGLRRRRFAPIVRLEVGSGTPSYHRARLAAELGLDEQADVFEVDGLMALGDLQELAEIKDPSLHYVPHHPVDHPAMIDDRNMFDIIREAGPILLHHPYESFATSVERLLKDASRDPAVRAIKISLYRTSEDTKVIDYLTDAARNGKQVAVVFELKARFDEEANIRWANYLEEMGVHVTYGVIGLKTHCKAILVVRQDRDGLRRYTHVGTGNYHAGTARQYVDLALLTCDEPLGQDLTELFNYLTTGYKPKRKYRAVLTAPKMLKQALLDKIGREIDKHSNETPGLLQFKMNGLEDPDVTRALYRASQAGVRVDLIVRDSCRLRPQLPGLSDNVRVLSLVGRFLEHSRIYYFHNGGESEYYIGSADCMQRNLEARVEVLALVDDPALQGQLRFILDRQLEDTRNAWEMQPDGSYWQRRPAPGAEPLDCQQAFAEWSEKRLWQATRLRRRRSRVVRPPRNVRLPQ